MQLVLLVLLVLLHGCQGSLLTFWASDELLWRHHHGLRLIGVTPVAWQAEGRAGALGLVRPQRAIMQLTVLFDLAVELLQVAILLV